MHFELKNVKINQAMSEGTTCFSATLYINGKKAAEIMNRGHGGNDLNRFYDKETEKAYNDHIKSLPPCQTEYGPLEMCTELFISDLLEKYEEQRFLKTRCKKKTLFRLKGDKKGTWRIIDMPYNEQIKGSMATKYGEALEVIGNELINKALTAAT